MGMEWVNQCTCFTGTMVSMIGVEDLRYIGYMETEKDSRKGIFNTMTHGNIRTIIRNQG